MTEPYQLAREAASVHNGHLVEVDWPDFVGKIGYQPASEAPQCSYLPNRSGDRPKAGDRRVIPGHGTYEVLKVARNPFMPSMTTLDLRKVNP